MLKYFNNVKLGSAKKIVKEKLAGIKSAIVSKTQMAEVAANEDEKKKLKTKIKALEKQLTMEDELVLEEYLKMNGRVEDEKGNKIMNANDISIGEERVLKSEQGRKGYIETQVKKRK